MLSSTHDAIRRLVAAGLTRRDFSVRMRSHRIKYNDGSRGVEYDGLQVTLYTPSRNVARFIPQLIEQGFGVNVSFFGVDKYHIGISDEYADSRKIRVTRYGACVCCQRENVTLNNDDKCASCRLTDHQHA